MRLSAEYERGGRIEGRPRSETRFRLDVGHRVIRIEREEADHCLAKQRAGLLVSSINPRLSASDGQQ